MAIRPILLLGFALLFVLVGCNKDGEEDSKSRRPQVKVNLPPSPEMTEKRFATKYVDGSYRVDGLIRARRKLINTHVQVKGFIKEVHRCATDGDRCDPPAHAVLVDDLSRPGRRLVVVGGEGTRFEQLEQGMKDTFEGYYQTSDPDGLFVRMEGILLLKQLAKADEDATEDSGEAKDRADPT